jgi:hypothetical protein
VSSTGGRPTRCGYVHFLATRRRCQRKIVPGVTNRCPHSIVGRARTSAAKTARSAQSRRGFGLALRSTATSWRSTRSSTSLTPTSGQATPAVHQLEEDQVEQTQGHGPRSCRGGRTYPSPMSEAQTDFGHPTGPVGDQEPGHPGLPDRRLRRSEGITRGDRDRVAQTIVQTCIVHLLRKFVQLCLEERLGSDRPRSQTYLYCAFGIRRAGCLRRVQREIGKEVSRDHSALDQRLGRVRALPAV